MCSERAGASLSLSLCSTFFTEDTAADFSIPSEMISILEAWMPSLPGQPHGVFELGERLREPKAARALLAVVEARAQAWARAEEDVDTWNGSGEARFWPQSCGSGWR